MSKRKNKTRLQKAIETECVQFSISREILAKEKIPLEEKIPIFIKICLRIFSEPTLLNHDQMKDLYEQIFNRHGHSGRGNLIKRLEDCGFAIKRPHGLGWKICITRPYNVVFIPVEISKGPLSFLTTEDESAFL